jgi:hypothetical protein
MRSTWSSVMSPGRTLSSDIALGVGRAAAPWPMGHCPPQKPRAPHRAMVWRPGSDRMPLFRLDLDCTPPQGTTTLWRFGSRSYEARKEAARERPPPQAQVQEKGEGLSLLRKKRGTGKRELLKNRASPSSRGGPDERPTPRSRGHQQPSGQGGGRTPAGSTAPRRGQSKAQKPFASPEEANRESI